jgi:hypothetical protein
MSLAVLKLQRWFDSLDRDEQEEVVKFLYDSEILLQEGLYCGPEPGTVTKGLHCGPMPRSIAASQINTRVCPTCRRPL